MCVCIEGFRRAPRDGTTPLTGVPFLPHLYLPIARYFLPTSLSPSLLPLSTPSPHLHSLSSWVDLLFFSEQCTEPSHHHLHPPSPPSRTAALHQLRDVPARGERSRGATRARRISAKRGERGETDGEKRDHGCSVCRAEDLGDTADPVSGSGPSGECAVEDEMCFIAGDVRVWGPPGEVRGQGVYYRCF